MFGHKATLPVDWVFPTPSVEKRTMYHWTGDMLEERQERQESMREVQGGRVKPLTQNILARCLVWYFDPRIIPGTSHKLRSFWVRTIPGDEADSSGLGGDQTGVLSQRRMTSESRRTETILGKDVICQNPEERHRSG